MSLRLTLANYLLIAGSDFVGIELVFNEGIIRYGAWQAPVHIINDNTLEEMIESFTAILTSITPRLILLPDVATVDIIDDDRKPAENDVTLLSGYSVILCFSSCYFWI